MAKKETTTKTPTQKRVAPKKDTTPKSLGLIPGNLYNFKSNGKNPSLKKDQVFKVSGIVAEELHKKGLGIVID